MEAGVTTMTVTKSDDGRLVGLGEKDRRAYGRFKKMIDGMGDGEFFTLEYWFPRNGGFHRKHMALMTALFDSQERFEDDTAFRKYLEIGAGYCTWAPGAKGGIVAIPKSIAYSKLDDEGLAELHEKVKAFVRSERPQRWLWPHLTMQQRGEMVESVLSGFDHG